MRDTETRSIAYQVLRYMDHLSDSTFAQRACDIYLNAQLGTPPHIMVNPPPMGCEYLWRDVVDEAHRRFGDSAAERFVDHVQRSCAAAWQSRPRLIPALSDNQLADFIRRADVAGKSFLIRYSKRERLEALVTYGRLRIFPATRYDDPSLNPFIRDKELELTIQPHGLTAEVFSRTNEPKGSIRVIDNQLTSVSPTNYYVHCLSGLLSPDLFADFDADACVVIWDPKLYVRRILDGLHAQLPYPAWGGDI
jgi:hypothetical protein